MSFPTTEHIPDNPENLPPARRRRAHRLLTPMNMDDRAALLEKLGHRASPSFDFFLLSAISGLVMSVGLWVDEPAVLVLGAALAPLMAPVIGIALGTVIGSAHFFLRSLFGLLVGCLLAFFTGYLTGVTSKYWLSHTPAQAYIYSQIFWPNFLVLAAAAVLTTIAIARSEDQHFFSALPSVALSYELYLPLVAAGFGFSRGIPHLWPDGLVVFALHLAWSALLGAITLALMGFRPLTLFGYTIGGAMVLLGVILLIGISGAGIAVGTHLGLPTFTPSPTPTYTTTPSLTPTPVPPTFTFTPTLTPSLTLTPTNTPTSTPTPILGIVRTDLPEGARIRTEPGGETIGFISNGALIILLPEEAQQGGTNWVHVIAPGGIQGWIVQSLVVTVTATPAAP